MPSEYTESIDSNSSLENNTKLSTDYYVVGQIDKLIKTIIFITNDMLEKPGKYFNFAYFDTDHYGKPVFLELSDVLIKYKLIWLTFLTRIGFGYPLLGALVVMSLPVFTLFTLICFIISFWIVSIPQWILIPFTLGGTIFTWIISMIIYSLIAFLFFVMYLSLWIGLVTAAMGIGFIYDD